jgi:hypothetical protein
MVVARSFCEFEKESSSSTIGDGVVGARSFCEFEKESSSSAIGDGVRGALGERSALMIPNIERVIGAIVREDIVKLLINTNDRKSMFYNIMTIISNAELSMEAGHVPLNFHWRSYGFYDMSPNTVNRAVLCFNAVLTMCSEPVRGLDNVPNCEITRQAKRSSSRG